MVDSKGSKVLDRLGLVAPLPSAYAAGWLQGSGPGIHSLNPATGEVLGTVAAAGSAEYERVLAAAQERFLEWRTRPAPKRGELVRRLGEALRELKEPLGELVSLEVGKIRSEGLGEVQEMIDICDFAVGLSRQLYGLVMPSERPRHRMFEQWLPLGVTGVVTAFNFPAAVWAWNAAIAVVCGDVCVWKPSPHAPLTALAVQHLCARLMKEFEAEGLFTLLVDGAATSERIAKDGRIPLVSFTGSVAAGKKVAAQVASRLGRSILELGGNNAIVVLDDADLDLAVRAITFGAVGTAGQRCTTTRRLFLHRAVSERVTHSLVGAYQTVRVGDPLAEGTLMGPLISAAAVSEYEAALELARQQGGKVLSGGKKLGRDGFFVEPTLVRAPSWRTFPVAHRETFAPILYLFDVDSLDEALEAQNSVPQGLSSALFTEGLRSAERFLSAAGSDCGIANVNIGTSGAEIGGAFGGEKETGGGREAGSDSWKAYMRRQTCTVNYGSELALAQGVQFPTQ